MVYLLPAWRVCSDCELPRSLHVVEDLGLDPQMACRAGPGESRPSSPLQLGDAGQEHRDVPATEGSNRSLPIPGRSDPHTMVKASPHHGQGKRQLHPHHRHNTWRAGCGERRTSGSEGGPGKPTPREAGRAPRSDPYSKLRGPNRGEYYDLYVIIYVFSRYVVGWLLAPIESAKLATDFVHDAVLTQGLDRDHLTIHADRGSSMRSKPVSQLMVDLGVSRSHSRPHVSNDNPYSEAAFKTLKYCPASPDRFGSVEHARASCVEFFEHCNHVHRHSGIALHPVPTSPANCILVAEGGVGQPASRQRGGCTELVNRKRLKSLDRFRGEWKGRPRERCYPPGSEPVTPLHLSHPAAGQRLGPRPKVITIDHAPPRAAIHRLNVAGRC